MRQLIRELLSNNGVPCVPSVPNDKTPHEQRDAGRTPNTAQSKNHGVPSVPEHLEHPSKNNVFPRNPSIYGGRTPGTPRTPENDTLQDFIDDYEERAAIIEFDGCIPRAKAEMIAFKLLMEESDG